MLAVADVSFEIQRGECLGLVGEAAAARPRCRKMHHARGRRRMPAQVRFNDRGDTGSTCWRSKARTLSRFRRKIQFIFQDPFGALNPRMTVFDIIGEPLGHPRHRRRAERRAEMVKD